MTTWAVVCFFNTSEVGMTLTHKVTDSDLWKVWLVVCYIRKQPVWFVLCIANSQQGLKRIKICKLFFLGSCSWENGAWDGPEGWCSIYSTAYVVPDHCGEEGAEPEYRDLNFPVHLHSKWPRWVSFTGWPGSALEIGKGARTSGEELSVEPLLLHAERSQLRWYGIWFGMWSECLLGLSGGGGVSGMSNWRETLGQTQNPLEGLHSLSRLRTPRDPPGGARMDVWMDGWTKWLTYFVIHHI